MKRKTDEGVLRVIKADPDGPPSQWAEEGSAWFEEKLNEIVPANIPDNAYTAFVDSEGKLREFVGKKEIK